MTSTCLHHSHLEVSPESYIAKLKSNLNTDLRTLRNMEMREDNVNINCQKQFTKKSVSIPAQYKPTHNKSETGHKQKSCPVHKKKKMKDPETFTPFVSDHLIKTY